MKQKRCFRAAHTSVQVINSRRPILWFCTGFRKGGKILPIQSNPLATVLKSDYVTHKNEQGTVNSVEFQFARQLIETAGWL